MAVVLYHTGLMTYGYLGVDLFLVVAGYLTTKSLYKTILVNEGRGVNTYISFEIGRVIRLLPPLLIAGFVCMLLGYITMLPDDYENLSESVVATNGFANNFLAAITTKNYWDITNEYKPLMHTWYVGLVMQFYILYPILFLLARLDRNDSNKSLLTMICFISVVSLLIYFGISDNSARFYFLPSRFFEFTVGGIVAILYKHQVPPPFKKWFVYACYLSLLVLIAVNVELMPSIIRLVAVVALTCVILCSETALDNNVTGNKVLAKIGAASYSIFIWHQILLAFCRYSWTNHFTIGIYFILFTATALLSWFSYNYIENTITNALKTLNGKKYIYLFIISSFVILTLFSIYIFKKGGVVRDVPELYISKNQSINHKAYNDKIYELDKPFETEKKHWLVVGNSFGRDFSNVILESEIAGSIEVSYIFIDDYTKPEKAERFKNADRVFLSTLGVDKEEFQKISFICQANGVPLNKLTVVGIKNFGESNGQFYIKRNSPEYFEQRTMMEAGYWERNENLKIICGENYLDLIGLVVDKNRTVPVFTPDHHYVSQDCRHFSIGGAKWFSKLIDWDKYLN